MEDTSKTLTRFQNRHARSAASFPSVYGNVITSRERGMLRVNGFANLPIHRQRPEPAVRQKLAQRVTRWDRIQMGGSAVGASHSRRASAEAADQE